ncbi:alanine racemase C-terminal domain-containing protein [Microbacterium sp.]|uniref:alanine racemase C-terminal domain-containing protein n=1 Tax=Microbacterium sp. TaxID=51671 RepID=UPI0037C67E26
MADIGPLRVAVSRGALVANARLAGEDAIADLRREAYGHGITVVAQALAEAGVAAAIVDETGRAAAEAAGLAVTDASPTLDSRTLYGLPGGAGAPAMRLSGSILSTKRLLAGEGVSYNATHVAARDTRIALVSGGFGQGVVRALGNRVDVELAGRRHPIVGRVAMDVCVVDIGDEDAAPGDEVVYFGGTGPLRDGLAAWEQATGLTGAELVCALGVRAATPGLWLRREVVG